MNRIKYGYSKDNPPKGSVDVFNCNNQFYVISKQAYKKIQDKLKIKRPVFYTDLPVYIDGVNI